MRLLILFNWPPGQNSARISFTLSTLEDEKFKFRAGVAKKEDGERIFWLKDDWVDFNILNSFEFDVGFYDKIIIEKKNKSTGEITYRHIWEIEKEWPAGASNRSQVQKIWVF